MAKTELKPFSKESETGCCPRFNPKPWQNKTITWKNKPFIKDKVTTFFHIPLNFGSVIIRMMKKIQDANAQTKSSLCISDEYLFHSDLYIAVSKPVKDANNIKMSGTFLTKVFEGPYKSTSRWIKEMTSYVKSKNKILKKIYFFYTTCPKCAKYYGKNYIVLLARIN